MLMQSKQLSGAGSEPSNRPRLRIGSAPLRRLDRVDVRLAADRVRARNQRPTLEAVAEELRIDVSTLKRIAAKLNMGRWPPPPLHEGDSEPI